MTGKEVSEVLECLSASLFDLPNSSSDPSSADIHQEVPPCSSSMNRSYLPPFP